MWELDHKVGWVPKNWCFRSVVQEKTLESPLDSKEIKPVNPKGNQPWIFIGRTDAEAPMLWAPDTKSWLIGTDPDVGKDWRQKEKSTVDDEMIRSHRRLNARLWPNSWSLCVKGREAWHGTVHGDAKGQTWLSTGTTAVRSFRLSF